MPSRFPDDEKTCKSLCPASEATLLRLSQSRRGHEPGGLDQRAALFGDADAFRYRNEFVPSCSCKAAGQTWSDALKSIDDKAAAEQQGDIIVTEAGAKKMSAAALEDGSGRRPGEGWRRACHDGQYTGSRAGPFTGSGGRFTGPRAGKGQADPFSGTDLHSRALKSRLGRVFINLER